MLICKNLFACSHMEQLAKPVQPVFIALIYYFLFFIYFQVGRKKFLKQDHPYRSIPWKVIWGKHCQNPQDICQWPHNDVEMPQLHHCLGMSVLGVCPHRYNATCTFYFCCHYAALMLKTKLKPSFSHLRLLISQKTQNTSKS